MRRRVYGALRIKDIDAGRLTPEPTERAIVVGVDVGKQQLFAVWRRADGTFERPWKINNPGEMKAAGEKNGFEVATEEDFKLGATLGKAGTSPALDEAIFALKEGNVTKTPIKVGDNWVIVGATKRIDADLAKFASQRDGLTQSLLSERQNQVFDDYISQLQQRLKNDGKIEIYKDVLATLEDDEPVAAPPINFPMPTK